MSLESAKADPYRYFRIESEELVGILTRGFLEIEKGSGNAELLADMNRAAHSMKGAARLVELFEVGDLAHALEDRLAQIGSGEAIADAREAHACLAQVDDLERLLRSALGEQEVSVGTGPGPIVPPMTAPVSQTNELRTESMVTESGVIRAPHDNERKASLEAGVIRAPDTGPEETALGAFIHPQDTMAPVSTQTLLEISRCAGELIELGNHVVGWNRELRSLSRALNTLAISIERAKSVDEIQMEHLSVPGGTPMQRNEHLHSINTRQFLAWADSLVRGFEEELDRVGPLSNRLYTHSLKARMVRIDEFGYRFEKVVRDAANELGKAVTFKIIGGDIQLDREVIQSLLEPLSHLLRNAVAHGIEPCDKREAADKPATGNVSLIFERNTNGTRILVEDDGYGIPPELHARIFEAGFSTREHLDQIAGRGIGLDAVQAALTEMRGRISVESDVGHFTRFDITVPANLDVLDVFAVDVGQQDFVLPLSAIRQTQLLDSAAFTKLGDRDAVVIDGVPVPLSMVSTLIKIDAQPGDATRVPVVEIGDGSNRLALVVDGLKGKQRVVIKKAGPGLGGNGLVNGVTIMPDGRPAFLLDCAELLERARDGDGIEMVARAPETTVGRTLSVLIVDDSLTTRMLEKAILEGAGYGVNVGRDGYEALDILARDTFDLIITDLEMPGMDGLEFAGQVQAQPHLADIPMIMLTSRGDEEDRRHGLEAGMQAYLVKGNFDQGEFLGAVRAAIGGPGG